MMTMTHQKESESLESVTPLKGMTNFAFSMNINLDPNALPAKCSLNAMCNNLVRI